MATGIVKSFNPSKGYGFIKTDSGGADVFVHLSAVRKAGLTDLRKGQKISFEIFDNQGKAAARDRHVVELLKASRNISSAWPERAPKLRGAT